MLCTISAFSQRFSDLTLHLSTHDDTKIALEYRIPVKEKWSLNFALAYGSKYSYYDRILEANDSLYTERHTSYSSSIGTLRVGSERRIKEFAFLTLN